MNENNSDIKQQIKQKSIDKAIQNGTYEEIPSWISQTSWGISIFISIIGFCMLIQDSAGHGAGEVAAVIFSLISTLFGLIIYKFIIYAVLVGIYKIFINVPKTIGYVADKGSKAIDSVGVTVVKKAQTIMENAKEENKIEQEKQILKNRINDLELQKLKKRVAELESELNNKE